MELFESDLQAFADDVRLADLAECTVRSYQCQLCKYRDWCRARKLETTSIRQAKAFLVETRGRSQSVAYVASRAIKRFGKWYAKEHSTDHPFDGLPFVKEPPPAPQRTATTVDVAALLLVVGGDDITALRDRALVLVMVSSGMRRSEIARMEWGHVDLATGTVVVPITKTRRFRTARLDREARQALKRYWHHLLDWELKMCREPSDFVWIS